jgi:hypothetical protein
MYVDQQNICHGINYHIAQYQGMQLAFKTWMSYGSCAAETTITEAERPPRGINSTTDFSLCDHVRNGIWTMIHQRDILECELKENASSGRLSTVNTGSVHVAPGRKPRR